MFPSCFQQDARAALAVASARAQELGVPLIYFGHSLGGLIGAALATDPSPPQEVDAYVLSAPTVKVGQPYMVVAAKLAASCVPEYALGQLVVRGAGGCTNNAEFAERDGSVIPAGPHELVFEPKQPNLAVSATVKFVAGAKRYVSI